MDDQLNNDLKNRINKVFDSFEAPPAAADTGWAELRKKYPAKQNRRLKAWWWSSAAALLLLLLFAWWFYRYSPGSSKLTKIKVQAGQNSGSNVIKPVAPAMQLPSVAATVNPALPVKQGNYFSKATSHKADLPPFNSRINKKSTSSGLPVNADSSVPMLSLVQSKPSDNANDSTSTVQLSIHRVNTVSAAPTLQDSTADRKAPATMEQVFAREKTNPQLPGTAKPHISNQGVTFDVYAGTYVNYAKGSNNQVNAGIGVASNIKLSSRIKLVTGLAIAQNRLGYNTQPAQGSVYNAAIIAVARQQNTQADISTYGTQLPLLAGNTVINSYSAMLTNLDIPLNIRYDLSTGPKQSYLMAGVSSGTFVNESYRYNYTYAADASQSTATQNRFSTFDFAHTLNVAFGIATPVGKTNKLFIEPFIKYPLSGLGAYQVRFGAGGVNLKFSLSAPK